ncbi:MAG TPA: oligoribonuclease [Candidatus Nanoperiomorbaceae bacterium]|nr:oligoribonuclease [Candidatus Nanoperiomorbaceae bacterium]HMQ97266.1 oligoribonuclease [Candidatus Nanoperiomorbaceae bacterium]HMR86161.1 oligoribonuclease [Candidatus Nanoperiomorbaceae bacterium]HMU11974.1 oligoribonuclease [Candidatus Nanoperiomorbaceae bacterium]
MKKASLLWIDLEMTGLDPKIDRIIEIGAVATDWDFNEIARYEAAVKVDADLIKQRMIGEFWDKNSVSRDQLITSSTEAESASAVEKELLGFLQAHFDTDQPIYLAGNSIHQDRKFIEREWPLLDKQLHYRMLDVSAWKLVFEHKLNKKFTKPEAHRAMSDIEGSIDELTYYLGRVKS